MTKKTGIDRATVFGYGFAVSTMKAEWTPESMPDYFQLMTGAFLLRLLKVYLLSQRVRRPLRKLQGYGAD